MSEHKSEKITIWWLLELQENRKAKKKQITR